MTEFAGWSTAEARDWVAVPLPRDDKYSRGVLGVLTGSHRFPGAAVIGVDAALHTGVGMVRYLGPERATDLVLARRPEVVITEGRVQAWLIGSGMDAEAVETASEDLVDALESGVPLVIDAGAIDLVRRVSSPAIITPHAGELARQLGAERAVVEGDGARAASVASRRFGVTVLLKGNTTHVAAPNGVHLAVKSGSTWLATAGTGDALAGIVGALVATHADEVASNPSALARLGATAAVVHSMAAERFAGPFTVLDLNRAVADVIAELIA
ncbi:ADP/ATP-dependent (S)-NAD(P)H-hydrate dehydratase [Cryobacterium sp. BB307]|uniref:ADP-dependent NAD(P)H-hydrate dehydratase n=1 Tax=Cryobacterium sp. BB307 TaxID=2716317 RepID=UPI001446CEC0|nr:ADP/ATP-dependent (S)-NAD(P)H-hydrate dehydratase [Cryobacterium sp. BB307]